MKYYVMGIVFACLIYLLFMWLFIRKKSKSTKIKYLEMVVLNALLFLVLPFLFNDIISLGQMIFVTVLAVFVDMLIALADMWRRESKKQ